MLLLFLCLFLCKYLYFTSVFYLVSTVSANKGLCYIYNIKCRTKLVCSEMPSKQKI